jgi:hypothetical protein
LYQTTFRRKGFKIMSGFSHSLALQATRDDRPGSASRFTVFGPACLSSGR